MRHVKYIIVIGILVVLLVLIGCSTNTPGNVIADSGKDITIPLSSLSNNVQFYSYSDNGLEIKYFVVLGSDGQPRTAFDACDVCGGYKGYRQDENEIICNNCGKVFSIDGLGTKNKGYGCWPSYLPHTIQGNNVIIKIEDIKAGRFRFA